ncbi:zinc finger and BTB domain containing 40 [Willisornis vidua]|uniref:Zinc finger and BTB domain containing 40 n=1 Tax=Willisornis vidua TaxID=1566151 RepID=A0ABQ9DSF1_9PASS|nr:zinc finger and BTB domain containing 40 [Willisornis vidua]
MELPSWQLLPQLYTLCKEQHFCNRTIFIGNMHCWAHEVVLAAASLLFKSLLDSSNSTSIDASVVTPEEFVLLLEMMYSDKLPLGKHNFTKVISVADSLHMFDVAVSCKNLLRDLISCSLQDQVVKRVSSQAADSSEIEAEANNPPQSGKLKEGKRDILLTQRVFPLPGPVEAEMEADVSPPGQELTMNHTWVHQDFMSSGSRSLQEDSGSGPDLPAHAKWSGCVEKSPELAEPPEGKGQSRDLVTASLATHLFNKTSLLSISAQKESREISLKAALSTAQEKYVLAMKICQLLYNVYESFPDLQPVMQELGCVGLLTKGSGEKPGIRKWKVNSESPIEALDKDKDKAGGAGAKEPKESQDKASYKKCFFCKTCDKTFYFY